MPAPLGSPHLRLLRASRIARLAAGLRPDVVMERYHNFGGEALTAARGVGALAVLEVNAPVVDHPGSPKALVDRALLIRPMQRWRERLVKMADLIVTPSAAILPPGTPADRIRLVEWGADTDRFHPGAAGAAPFERPSTGTVAVFAGAFRNWHGAINLVRSIKTLQAGGRREIGAVLIGDGPELPRVRAEAAGVHEHRVDRHAAARVHAGSAGRGRHRRGAVRPVRSRSAEARLLLVAAEDFRVHGRRPAGGRAVD